MSSFLKNIEKDVEYGVLNLLGNALQANEAAIEPAVEAAVAAGESNATASLIALVEKDETNVNPFVKGVINASLEEYAPQLEALLPTVAASASGYVPKLVAAIFALRDKVKAS